MTTFIHIASETVRNIFDSVNYAILSTIFCVFGIVSNVINIVIFHKQGLDSTTNISFFSLAVSDLFGLLSLLWTATCNNPLVSQSHIPMDTPRVQYLTGAAPHACFSHITCWITAYITAERCLCIAIPLKVKQVLTPHTTTILICVIYIINIASFVPEYCTVYLDWVYYADRNRSLLTLAFTEDRGNVEGLMFVFFAILGALSFPTVIVFTVILVVKLRQQAKWRQKTAKDENQNVVTTKRDIKTVKLVVLIATVLIVCYTPGVVASPLAYFISGFHITGENEHLFFIVWSFVFVFDAFNSSINIIFYYKMSTKYKNTFHSIFRSRCCKTF